jgi:CheY-like chemotaxis protein
MTEIDTLLVEEGATRLEQTLRALQDGGIHTVFHAADPRLAREYLLSDTSPAVGHIQLIILELLLPQPDRLELLTALKRDQRTHAIPSIVLAALDKPRDIARCYASGANIVIRRPDDDAKLVEKARAIANWCLARIRDRESASQRIVVNRPQTLEPTGDDTFAGAIGTAY